MSNIVKFIFIMMLGISVWSIGSFIFGAARSTTEKVTGKTETELIDFARSVYDNIKAGKIRDFAAQVFDLKSSSLKESYEYLRYIKLADKPEWSVEKHIGENGFYITFKTPDATRAFMLVDRKNDRWKFVYAGQ